MELLEQILTKENLNKAYKKVCQNKGAPGVDGITVEEVSKYLKENKNRILKQIRERRYKPQPARRVQIPKENGKKRNLGIPTVVDRIIQQGIVQIISPIFEEQFSENSYGFRPNRSCEQAVIKALEYLNDGYDWIVDIDLENIIDKKISKCRSNGKWSNNTNKSRNTTRWKPKSITKQYNAK